MGDLFYEELDSNQIRLFTLRPGQLADELKGDLSAVSLNDSLEYEALSYTWGNLQDLKTICLNGTEFQVTINLESALRCLRQADVDRTIWIDAICINQKSNEERNHQVRQMDKIYKQASKVIVWLGPSSMISSETIDGLETLADDPSLHWTSEKGKRSVGQWYSSPRSDEVHLLFNCAWWTRVWTLQEALLARNLVFVCGFRTLSEDFLLKIRESHAKHAGSGCCFLLRWLDNRLFLRFNSVMELRRYWERYGMLRIVSKQRWRECHDARDMIYGLLGLATESYFKSFHPAYQQPLCQVYTDFARICLEKSGNLAIFSHLIRASESECPSWVPDWSVRVKEAWGAWVAERAQYLPFFRAAGNTSPTINHVSERSISASGCCLDVVSEITSVSRDIDVGWRDYENWWTSLYLDRRADDHYSAGGDWKNAFLRTLLIYAMQGPLISDIIDRVISNLDQNEVQDLDHAQLATRLIDTQTPIPVWAKRRIASIADLRRKSPLLNLKDRISTLIARTRSPGRPVEDINGLDSAIRLGTYERRLAITRKDYLGLIPAAAQVGDKICLLFGGNVPYVLRQVPTVAKDNHDATPNYIILGDCYVHGLMYGEGLEMMKQQRLQEQDFVLV